MDRKPEERVLGEEKSAGRNRNRNSGGNRKWPTSEEQRERWGEARVVKEGKKKENVDRKGKRRRKDGGRNKTL